MFLLIIFDCDGVLVDSENLAAEVFSSVLKSEGILMTAQQCFDAFKGMTLPGCYKKIENDFSCKLSSSFDVYLREETERVFSSSLKAVEGVPLVLGFLLEHGVSFCVASNGGIKKIKNSLEVTGLKKYFSEDKIFSAENVSKGKPSPDLFLYSASKQQINPKDCWVVEDSALGVQAATSAGMFCVGFGGVKADVEVRSMTELNSLISERYLSR